MTSECEGAEAYDLLLRMTERSSHIAHITEKMSYSETCRQACCFKEYEQCDDGSQKALKNTLIRRNCNGSVMPSVRIPHAFRVRRALDCSSKVSIIIPTKNHLAVLKACFESLIRNTTHKNYECIIVDNGSTEHDFLEYERELSRRENCTLLHYDKPYNFSAINNLAAGSATGEYLVFLNDDTEIIDGEWLSSMLEHAQRKEVGIVGCKLLYKDSTIQHAGVVIGVNELGLPSDVGGHCYKHSPDSFDGYFGTPHLIRDVGAVSAACMMVRKSVFTKLGGFDETLAVDFNDVDLCLNARNHGYSVVYTPYATLIHHEALNRGHAATQHKRIALRRETEYIKRKWGDRLTYDPYYNKNLIRKQRYGLLQEKTYLLLLYYKRYGLFFTARMLFHYFVFKLRNAIVLANIKIQRFFRSFRQFCKHTAARRRARGPFTGSLKIRAPKDASGANSKTGVLPRLLMVVPSYKVDDTRYRVSHICEYFSLANMQLRVFSEDVAVRFNAQDIADDIIILYRLIDSEPLSRFICSAQKARIPVVYSIDDLLFSPDAVKLSLLLPKGFSCADMEFYASQAERRLCLLSKCDYFLATTEFLANKASSFVKKSFVLRNGFCKEQLEIARRLMLSSHAKKDKSVVIGYISGTKTHEHDFFAVRDVLINILEEHPYSELKIIGFLDHDAYFKQFGMRFSHISYVPWREVFSHLQTIDINIAPFETNNPFTESKSEIKYIEAALMKIPTIASPIESYCYAIEHGKNGFLASSQKEWHEYLTILILNEQERKRIGQAAYTHTVSRYSPEIAALEAKRIIQDIRGCA